MGAWGLVVLKLDDEVITGLCSKTVFQMLISHWCFRRWCTKPVCVHKFCMLTTSSWYTNPRCCNYFTSRQDLSEGGSGKGNRTFWNWKIPCWSLIPRDREIWKSSACNREKTTRSRCLVENIGIFQFLYQAHGNVFIEENVLICNFCAHTWGFYLFFHVRNYVKVPLMYQSTDFLETCFVQSFPTNLLCCGQRWETCLWGISESKNS